MIAVTLCITSCALIPFLKLAAYKSEIYVWIIRAKYVRKKTSTHFEWNCCNEHVFDMSRIVDDDGPIINNNNTIHQIITYIIVFIFYTFITYVKTVPA